MKGVKPHPKTPPGLRKAFRECGNNYYRTGEKLGINPSHIRNLIKFGREPKREDLRKKLFFRVRKSPEEVKTARLRRIQEQEKVNNEILQYFENVLGDKQWQQR